MTRYKYEMCSAVIDTFEKVNKTMNDFGFPGHALGARIGTIECNASEGKTAEEMRTALEKATNEVMKEKGCTTIWLNFIGEVPYKESE